VRPKPAISAHRRDQRGLTGLSEAAESGAEYVELDIRRTGDGRLVVHHDPDLAGLPLKRLTYERVQELSPRPVPLVSEAMQIIGGRAQGHLDLKERGCEHETVEMAIEAFGRDRFVVTTREVLSLVQIKRRAGVPAMVWTVNAEPVMRRFLDDPRVAILVTDHPEVALKLRDERFRPRLNRETEREPRG